MNSRATNTNQAGRRFTGDVETRQARKRREKARKGAKRRDKARKGAKRRETAHTCDSDSRASSVELLS